MCVVLFLIESYGTHFHTYIYYSAVSVTTIVLGNIGKKHVCMIFFTQVFRKFMTLESLDNLLTLVAMTMIFITLANYLVLTNEINILDPVSGSNEMSEPLSQKHSNNSPWICAFLLGAKCH